MGSRPGGEFVPAIEPDPGARPIPGWWCAFRETELLVRDRDGGADLPEALEPAGLGAGLAPVRRQFLGTLGGRPCWSAELAPDAEAPPGYRFLGLRSLFDVLPERAFALAGRAVQVVAWERDHAFCGRDGTPTAAVPGERARRCPSCGLTAYPRLSPAAIVLVERPADGAALLTRGHNFPANFYGLIAGFVEPGESLEEAVAREAAEEVGIRLADIRYAGSQPWPFPNSLMVGFTARWDGGDLVPQASELADAGWFLPDALPNLPPPPSIARRLIDAWAARWVDLRATDDQPVAGVHPDHR